MAIFEKTDQNKVVIDDTEKLICFVENTKNIDKHTEYVLKVQRGPSKDDKWYVSHRYRDFSELNARLQPAGYDLPLPPKKFFGNMQPSFIAERHKSLQNYMDKVLMHQKLSLSFPVRSFLDPNNYSKSISEEALSTISIALRGGGSFELDTPLTSIGWRIRKQYCFVREFGRERRSMLSWQSYGPDKYLEPRDMQAAFKSILNISLQHPYIDQILAIHSLESGAYVVRRIHENGSIRDILYGTDYSRSYLEKYANPKVKNPFTCGQIAHYGLQILQALKFLHDKDLPHGHIHPGNIMIDNQKALLVDIENGLLGNSCIYRPYLLEHKKICTLESVDVYCFAHTLYEMAFAEPLEKSTCDTFPSEISDELDMVLKSCLSPTACRNWLPSLTELMDHPFFSSPLSLSNGGPPDRIHLKFPLTLKEQLQQNTTVIEGRLKKEQKLVRTARREARIKEILNSEEEIKKQKRRLKKRDSWWKSSSSLSETVRSISSASSPTPPTLPETSRNSTSMSLTPESGSDGRTALLTSICSFDKNRLTRINSH